MVEKMVSAEDAVEYFLKRKDRKAKEKQFKRQTNFEPGVPKKVVIMGKEYPSKTSCYDDLKIQKKLVLKRMRDTNCSFEEAVIAIYSCATPYALQQATKLLYTSPWKWNSFSIRA